MEQWDLVKLYGRALRSGHYVEALCFGYQQIEYVMVVLLTKTTVGRGGKPLPAAKVEKADYLSKKAKLALDNDFVKQPLYDDEIIAFNRLRADIIHNAATSRIKHDDLKRCAEMVGPLYKKIQDLFLALKVGAPRNA